MRRTSRRWLLGGPLARRRPLQPRLDDPTDRIEPSVRTSPSPSPASTAQPCAATHAGTIDMEGALHPVEPATALHDLVQDGCNALARVGCEPAASGEVIPAPCEGGPREVRDEAESEIVLSDVVLDGDGFACQRIVVDPGTAARVARGAVDHGRTLRALRTARARRLAIALGLARATRLE